MRESLLYSSQDMDGSEIVISEIYCFLDLFFICLLEYLTYYYNSEAYVAFSVLDSGNNEMQDNCRDRQGFGIRCSFLSLH